MWEAMGVTPDVFYERKVVLGLLIPTWDYLTEAEVDATMTGRYKGDGRRMDDYTLPDYVEVPDG